MKIKMNIKGFETEQQMIKEVVDEHNKLITKSIAHMRAITEPENGIEHLNDIVINTARIMNKLQGIEFDKEAVIIAAYWHAVGHHITTKEYEDVSSNLLKIEMEGQGYTEEFTRKCCLAVKYHHWKMRPATIEGKILRDADKLSWVSIGRWTACINKKQRLDQIVALLHRLRNEILYFNETKELYDEDVVTLLQLLYDNCYNN